MSTQRSMTIAEIAVAHHEVFLSYLDAGFNDDQALALLQTIIHAAEQATQ